MIGFSTGNAGEDESDQGRRKYRCTFSLNSGERHTLVNTYILVHAVTHVSKREGASDRRYQRFDLHQEATEAAAPVIEYDERPLAKVELSAPIDEPERT